jgi:hypothetical protein
MQISKAGRQMASSATDASKAYELLQAQLVGAFALMPVLLPGSLGPAGDVRYGVKPEMGKEMARRAVDEVRARNALLPPHVQIAKVEKLIEDRKKVSLMVRLAGHAAYNLDVN